MILEIQKYPMLYCELESFSCKVDVVDPHANSEEVFEEYGYKLSEKPTGKYDAVIVAVNHKEYIQLTEEDFKNMMSDHPLLVDIKGVFRDQIKEIEYWSL